MALPKITPRSTSLSASVPRLPHSTSHISPISLSTIYGVYPARLPSAPELPHRINPLNPQPPTRRTVMLETIDPHWHNEKRTNLMKQREHYRYHNAWSKFYYGSPAEKESYKTCIRSVLKQQMADQWAFSRQNFTERVKESEQAVTYDQRCRMDDALAFQEKHRFLTAYRDDNKRLMESAWAEKRHRKVDADKFDREQLKYNPINWSCSLK